MASIGMRWGFCLGGADVVIIQLLVQFDVFGVPLLPKTTLTFFKIPGSDFCLAANFWTHMGPVKQYIAGWKINHFGWDWNLESFRWLLIIRWIFERFWPMKLQLDEVTQHLHEGLRRFLWQMELLRLEVSQRNKHLKICLLDPKFWSSTHHGVQGRTVKLHCFI